MNLNLHFQNAVIQKDHAKVREIIQNSHFNATDSLPNGALPYAFLLQKFPEKDLLNVPMTRTDLEAEDRLGLSATDHAYLTNNTDFLHTALLTKKNDIKNTALFQKKMQQATAALSNAKQFLEIEQNKMTRAGKLALTGTPYEVICKEDLSIDTYGMAPAHYAIKALAAMPHEKQADFEETVKKLIDDADITAKTKADFSLLHFSILAKTHSITKYLLEKNNQTLLESTTLTGLTALHLAFLMKDFETIKYFTDNKKDFLEKEDQNGLTPLNIYAVFCVEMLENAPKKAGLLENKELIFAGMHFLYLSSGYLELIIPSGYTGYGINTALFLLLMMEYAQSTDIVSAAGTAFTELNLRQATGITSYIAALFRIRRVSQLAITTASKMMTSWEYSTYNTYESMKAMGIRSMNMLLTAARELS